MGAAPTPFGPCFSSIPDLGGVLQASVNTRARLPTPGICVARACSNRNVVDRLELAGTHAVSRPPDGGPLTGRCTGAERHRPTDSQEPVTTGLNAI